MIIRAKEVLAIERCPVLFGVGFLGGGGGEI